ncbi:MAG: type I asparaginase [Bacteroidales bacterium]
MANEKTSILIIYTGGTIGMIKDPESGVLRPFSFELIIKAIPELGRFDFNISSYAFHPPIDSSNVNPDTWIRISEIIEQNYQKFDGFVILHGTDTMAYSASALSFMLENLSKPVIFTGSQLPIDALRTDGKENLISSLEIAASKTDGKATVPEVCIFFENRLFRGNRTSKNNVDDFNAFFSANYPPLAESGVHIKYNYQAIIKNTDSNLPLFVYKSLDTNIAILKIFPGINLPLVRAVITSPGLKALIIETFGAGNAPNAAWLIDELKASSDSGIVILNITQCNTGSVEMGMYETGIQLARAGVVGGKDITTEAAVAKLMYLLAKNLTPEQLKKNLNTSLRGEITL